MTATRNVVAKQSENGRVPNAPFALPRASSGGLSRVVTKLEFAPGACVGNSPSIDAVPVVESRVHSPAPSPFDKMSQYASNPSQAFVHLATTQDASLSPSHSSKGAMLEAA